MFEQVKEAIAKQLRIPSDGITAESRIKDDLGADSLDVLQLLMMIEEKFGISVPDEALVNFTTVGQIVKYLESRK